MSYEGYDQKICANGHYYQTDAYDDYGNCPECGAKQAWRNSVDQTNCDDVGEIPYDLLKKHFLISEAKTETCGACGHTKCISSDVFRIPTRAESDPLRHYRPEYGGTPLVPLNQKR